MPDHLIKTVHTDTTIAMTCKLIYSLIFTPISHIPEVMQLVFVTNATTHVASAVQYIVQVGVIAVLRNIMRTITQRRNNELYKKFSIEIEISCS